MSTTTARTNKKRGRPTKCNLRVLAGISLKLHDKLLTLDQAVEMVNRAFRAVGGVDGDEDLCAKTLRNRCVSILGVPWEVKSLEKPRY